MLSFILMFLVEFSVFSENSSWRGRNGVFLSKKARSCVQIILSATEGKFKARKGNST